MPLTKKKTIKPKKDAAKPAKAGNGNGAASHEEEGSTNSALDTVLHEMTAPPEKVHVEQWVSVECPYCGEGLEVHVTSENDGQTLSEDCHVCSRSIAVHVHAEDDELQVSAYRS